MWLSLGMGKCPLLVLCSNSVANVLANLSWNSPSSLHWGQVSVREEGDVVVEEILKVVEYMTCVSVLFFGDNFSVLGYDVILISNCLPTPRKNSLHLTLDLSKSREVETPQKINKILPIYVASCFRIMQLSKLENFEEIFQQHLYERLRYRKILLHY